MRNLFRSFERFGVDWLLISGQASILYGAATFSEDVDLWVSPGAANVGRLKRALSAAGAQWYKLTPPLTVRNMLAGHGFHFVVPERPLPLFLDIMGHPPRVGSFAAATATARSMKSDWGSVPVVSIEDLVEMKKTKRLSDYEVISNLAQIRLTEAPEDRVVQRWAAKNSYRPEDRREIFSKLGRNLSLEICRRRISREIAVLQKRDARYWNARIRALRRLRRNGSLMPEGELVEP